MTSQTVLTPSDITAEIGVIGGSGLYDFLDDYETVEVSTPFGSPSDPLVVGEVEGRSVAFMTRHGKDHRHAPHRVNYRANLWALRAIGVRQILSPCAVGSLRPEHGPGTLVVPDQLVDRTWGRPQTVYDAEGEVVHVGFADPYCPNGRQVAVDAARVSQLDVVAGGTLVVVNGPRFSTRAESLMHQQLGWDIVGMTTMPEAALARELALCFTTIALVTDLDAGVEGGDPVTHEEVMRVFAQNVEGLKGVLRDAVGQLPAHEDDETATCVCRRALDGITLPFPLP
ncbi:S-methyl-5'-thioadenosine phosphorylase [Intrasporangium calvum]|uniref:Purine nucleoside phosphorylase n=1 Tax=Intrasporangium calvum (strain ATCC 23552 / DSM 43043 / JCM 3097 / NBRC 12989 / NCIMB 10167 / NRRL B-3866 / 7 KIP) TaxID=710696 RepID=E6SC69_INTC7|nr:S-methyl-5'-thioadenosine phosphorylase [Intrasporangium calvum]ADU47413.1 methylthioadenosine phosphorylase [Intrasporangium calvum DSM 43043]AXG12628.1 S-methyl-5'-thioadenosine phosphorylase [Intrasporangium calvum]